MHFVEEYNRPDWLILEDNVLVEDSRWDYIRCWNKSEIDNNAKIISNTFHTL